jgi:hypothetical protein
VGLNGIQWIEQNCNGSEGIKCDWRKIVCFGKYICVSDKQLFPFSYLGLPMGTTNPKVEDFLPLVQRIERRLTPTSNFLTQASLNW